MISIRRIKNTIKGNIEVFITVGKPRYVVQYIIVVQNSTTL